MLNQLFLLLANITTINDLGGGSEVGAGVHSLNPTLFRPLKFIYFDYAYTD